MACKYTIQGEYVCTKKETIEQYADYPAGRGFVNHNEAVNSCPRVCGGKGGWNGNWVSKNGTSFCGCNDFQPASGSFVQSCDNCFGNVNDPNTRGWMQCNCKNTIGGKVTTRLDGLQNCPINGRSPQVWNQNGNLRCG